MSRPRSAKRATKRRPGGAASGAVRPVADAGHGREIPSSDARLAAALAQDRLADGPPVPGTIENARKAAGAPQAVYPYTKGITMVNDGVAYGEYVDCTMAYVDGEGKLTTFVDSSLRTRTGKIGTAES